MKYVLNSQEMKQYDENTMEYYKMSSEVLMERTALQFVYSIMDTVKDLKRCLVVCGIGNNGGDGIAIARLLHLRGVDVACYLAGNRNKATQENLQQEAIAIRYGVPFVDNIGQNDYDLVVDALFGIGLCREVSGFYEALINRMNQLHGFKAAVDIASGVCADDGRVLGTAFRADLTVTPGFLKLGHVLYPGTSFAGDVVIADMGIDDHSFLGQKPDYKILTREDLKRIPSRSSYSHKGTFGKVLLIAGKKNMAGACIFAAKAAYQTGCGMVKIYTPEENRIILQQQVPQALLETYDTDAELDTKTMHQLLQWADVVAMGPGIGTTRLSAQMLRYILLYCQKPVILDADALNILAKYMQWLEDYKCPLAITPHLMEMSRMIQKPVVEIQKQLLQTAEEFSNQHHLTCVLKDARTVIQAPDRTGCININGNSGMSVAGSGDVLTGIIAGLAAQKMELEDAAQVGVYLHAEAADEISERKGDYSLQAQDIIDGISEVLKDLRTSTEYIFDIR
ncbi:MAG: NAD(P)H-hydrate dehydratase [Lachnospiraceae bacterium]